MKKLYIDWLQAQQRIQEILRQISRDDWRPDYVVGITRGGLIPAVLISQYLGIPMHTLNVSLRDGGDTESNLWMAEHALGYNLSEPKNILIVDDINDTGATLNWIMKDWPSGCLPSDPRWEQLWNNNVRFAVLVDNEASQCSVGMDYVGQDINKAEEDCWVVFPWESWWAK